MSRPRVIYVDVDDTLVRSVGASRIPMPGVVQAVRALHAQGHTLYVWSSGGADYARQSAHELGLADCFAAFLPKPDAYIDDQPVHDWRFCRHVLPGNAADAGHPACPPNHSLISDVEGDMPCSKKS